MKSVQKMFVAVMLMITRLVYAGEFDDHCATGLAGGMLIKTKCEINAVFEDKTYCFASQGSKENFLESQGGMVKKAAEFYAKNSEPIREKISQADAIKQIKSQRCDLSNKDAGYLEFDGMDLRHCNMVNTSFFGAYLRGANLSGANMEHAYLNLARLESANLSYANLKDAIIFQAIFDKTNFKGANLSNARVIGTLGNVDMSEANVAKGRFGLDIGNQPMGAMRFDAVGGNFSNTNFEGADINRNNVRFGNFRNANLRNTNLFRADFSKADLTGADITGADLNEAVLDGTIMTAVKGIEAIKGYDRSKGECVDCNAITK